MCNSDPYRKADNLQEIRDLVESWRKAIESMDAEIVESIKGESDGRTAQEDTRV